MTTYAVEADDLVKTFGETLAVGHFACHVVFYKPDGHRHTRTY